MYTRMRWGRCTNFVYDSHVVMEMDFLKQAEETDEIPTKQAIEVRNVRVLSRLANSRLSGYRERRVEIRDIRRQAGKK